MVDRSRLAPGAKAGKAQHHGVAARVRAYPAARQRCERSCFVCGDAFGQEGVSFAARAGAGLYAARSVIEVCSAECAADPCWSRLTTVHAGW